jgi:hypothetical protein
MTAVVQRSVQYLVVDAVTAYPVSQFHSMRRSSIASASPSSISEKISGPYTFTYSTVSGWM